MVMKEKLRSGGWVVIAALAVGGALGASKPKFTFDPAKLFVNKAVPEDLTLKRYDTQELLDLQQWKGKKAVLLNFFATWCVPCKEETPTFVKVYEEYKAKGVEFISVDVREEETAKVDEALSAFMKKYGVTWAMAKDNEDEEIAKLFRIKGLPLNIGVGKDGIVKFYHTSKVDEAWLRAHLDWLITGKPPVEPVPLEKPVSETLKAESPPVDKPVSETLKGE